MCEKCAKEVVVILNDMEAKGEFEGLSVDEKELERQIMGMRLRDDIRCPQESREDKEILTLEEAEAAMTEFLETRKKSLDHWLEKIRLMQSALHYYADPENFTSDNKGTTYHEADASNYARQALAGQRVGEELVNDAMYAYNQPEVDRLQHLVAQILCAASRRLSLDDARELVRYIALHLPEDAVKRLS